VKLSVRYLLRLALLFSVLAGTFLPAGAQFWPTNNYGTPEYKLEPQNWQISELGDGRMAFANDGGLLIFDGHQWLRLERELNFAGRSVAWFKGRLFAGGEDIYGYLSPDSSGALQMIPLTGELPDSLHGFGYVNHICGNGERLYFQTDDKIFQYNDALQLEQIHDLSGRIALMYCTQNSVLAYLADSGLFSLNDGRFLPVTSHKIFESDPVVGINAAEEHKIQVFTQSGKIYELYVNREGYTMRTELSQLIFPEALQGRELKLVKALRNDLLGILPADGGCGIWNTATGFFRYFDKASGLKDSHIEDVLISKGGLLWFAMNSGLSSCIWNYPISGYSELQGIEGSVESIDRHLQQITASTSSGLYGIDAAKRRQFSTLIPAQNWDVCSFDSSTMLVATNNDISIFGDAGLETVVECYPWKLKKSDIDPMMFWIGLDPGVTALRMEGNSWRYSQFEQRIDQPINKIFEDSKGHIWFGSSANGIYTSDGFNWIGDSLDYPNLRYYGEPHGLPAGQVHVAEWKNSLRFATGNGFYILRGDTFIADTTLGIYPKSPLVHRIYTSPRQELWSVLYSDAGQFKLGYFEHPDSFQYQIFNPITREIFHSMFFDGDSMVWIGGPSGVFYLDRRMEFSINTPYKVHITNVSIMDDSSIFYGFYPDSAGYLTSNQPPSFVPSFHYKTNNISFQFAALTRTSADDVKYAHLLEGFDEKWSNWSSETKKEYTNLPPGDYVFKVKSIDIFESQSLEQTYSFTIEKPWYQTNWYYLGQATFLLILILVTVFLNHSGEGGEWSAVITFVTIITLFEFLILLLDPFIDQYADEVPIFKLLMNILLAISLNPAEHFIKGWIARRKGKSYVKD
jgi:hypothetical protein